MISIRVKDRATPYLKQVYRQEMNQVIGNLSTAADFVLEKFKDATTPSPNYSLNQLKAMGYPYGILPRVQPRSPIPHAPPWLINQQTGQLNRDMTVFPINVAADTVWIQVGVKEGSKTEEYGPMVIFGTRKMVGRNFMMESVMENLQTIRKLMIRSRVRKGVAWRGGIKAD